MRGPEDATDGGDGGRQRGRRRRRLLAAVAAGVASGVAGCGSLGGVGGDPDGKGTDSAGGDEGRDGTESGPAGPPADLPDRASASFRGGLRNRGYYPRREAPDDPAALWSLPGVNKGDHTAAKASAVPVDGGESTGESTAGSDDGGGGDGEGEAAAESERPDLIWPGDTGVVHRVTAAGDVVWSAATHPSGNGIHGTPVVAGDTVYVGAYDGALYALDLATGERRWRTPLGAAIGSSPAYHRGVVYVAVEFSPPDGGVFAVDARTGAVRARRGDPTDHPHSTAAVDPDAGVLAVGSNDGVLYGWEYPSLEPAWQFETGDAIKGPVAAHDGSAVVGSWDRQLYRVDLSSGESEWRYETDGKVMSGPAVDPRRDRVYVGSHDGHLHAVDLATGERAWRFDAGGRVTGCPVVTADRVLVGSYAGAVWAVDPDRGDNVWEVPTQGWVTATPRVVDGRVYVAERAADGRSGHAYAFGDG